MMASCTIAGNPSAFATHAFFYDEKADKYIIQSESNCGCHSKKLIGKKNPRSMTINNKGEVIEIKAILTAT